MYGYHPGLQKSFEDEGIKIEKVFTGNLDLLAKKELGCIHESELDGRSNLYYVILPFFLPDGGAAQREKLKRYGYKEYKDYIFFPDDEFVSDGGLADVFNLKKHIEGLKKQIEELKKENKALLPSANLIKWYSSPRAEEDELSARKRFFMDLPPAKGTLRDMQLAGVILLSKLDKVCRANNIPYWISFGTLLGSVRHGGFIPWDDDTDICMMRADAMRLTEIMQDDADFYVSHIFAEYDDNLNHCVQLKYRIGAPYCLDIFIYDYCAELNKEITDRQADLNRQMAEDAQSIRCMEIPKDKKDKLYSELLDKYLERSRNEVGTTNAPSKYMIWALDNYRCKESFQGNCTIGDIFPLKRVLFEGLEFNAPWSVEGYLTQKYGDIYSLPNDILSHVHFKLNSAEERVLGEILKKYGYLLNNEG